VDRIIHKHPNHSLQLAAKKVNLEVSLLSSWKKQYDRYLLLSNWTKKAIHPGGESILDPIEKELLQKIFMMREQALPVDNFAIRLKACELSSSFCSKGETAQISAVRRFMKKHGYVCCFASHMAQYDPKETVIEATDFMKVHCALLDKLVRDKR